MNLRRFTFENDHGARRAIVAESLRLAYTMLPTAHAIGAALVPVPLESWRLVMSEPA